MATSPSQFGRRIHTRVFLGMPARPRALRSGATRFRFASRRRRSVGISWFLHRSWAQSHEAHRPSSCIAFSNHRLRASVAPGGVPSKAMGSDSKVTRQKAVRRG